MLYNSISKKGTKAEPLSKQVRPIKCEIIGNRRVGKSSLAHTYVYQKYIATPWFSTDHHLTTVPSANGSEVELLICDTLCPNNDERIYRKSYTNADVFLICFSIDKPAELADIRLHWLPEIRHYGPIAVPIILVATKIDLHELNKPNRTVTYQQGKEMAKEIGAVDYMECSALDGIKVSAVFEAAVTYGVNYRLSQYMDRKKKHICCVV